MLSFLPFFQHETNPKAERSKEKDEGEVEQDRNGCRSAESNTSPKPSSKDDHKEALERPQESHPTNREPELPQDLQTDGRETSPKDASPVIIFDNQGGRLLPARERYSRFEYSTYNSDDDSDMEYFRDFLRKRKRKLKQKAERMAKKLKESEQASAKSGRSPLSDQAVGKTKKRRKRKRKHSKKKRKHSCSIS